MKVVVLKEDYVPALLKVLENVITNGVDGASEAEQEKFQDDAATIYVLITEQLKERRQHE